MKIQVQNAKSTSSQLSEGMEGDQGTLEESPDTFAAGGSGNGQSAVENISRSGRVRKKNVFLEGFESVDQIDKSKKPKLEKVKGKRGRKAKKVTLAVGMGYTAKNKVGKKKKYGQSSFPSALSRASAPYMGEGDLEIVDDLPPVLQDMSAREDDGSGYLSSDVDDRTNNGYQQRSSGYGRKKTGKYQKPKSQAQSTYMLEKSVDKPKKGVVHSQSSSTATHYRKPSKMTKSAGPTKKEKEKGTPRVTAYTLWAKEQRQVLSKKYPHIDAGTLGKRLSDMWQMETSAVRKMWKNKADKMTKKSLNIKNSAPVRPLTAKGKKRGRPRIHPLPDELQNFDSRSSPLIPVPVVHKTGHYGAMMKARKANSSTAWKTSKPVSPKAKMSLKTVTSNGLSNLSPADRMFRNDGSQQISPFSPPFSDAFARMGLPSIRDEMYRVTGTAPLDIAAHLSLLGESLSTIGERLMDMEGQPVAGSLSVLMDSLLCALAPLLCLTQQIPQLRGCIPQAQLNRILDSIAHIMPGV